MVRLSSTALAAAIAGLCLLQLVRALPYSASSPVVSLTESNFEAKIKNAGFCLVEVRPLRGGRPQIYADEHLTTQQLLTRLSAVAPVPCTVHPLTAWLQMYAPW